MHTHANKLRHGPTRARAYTHARTDTHTHTHGMKYVIDCAKQNIALTCKAAIQSATWGNVPIKLTKMRNPRTPSVWALSWICCISVGASTEPSGCSAPSAELLPGRFACCLLRAFSTSAKVAGVTLQLRPERLERPVIPVFADLIDCPPPCSLRTSSRGCVACSAAIATCVWICRRPPPHVAELRRAAAPSVCAARSGAASTQSSLRQRSRGYPAGTSLDSVASSWSVSLPFPIFSFCFAFSRTHSSGWQRWRR